MLSLARSSLIHEFQRYVPASLAVSFASLLLLLQMALLLGLFGTVTSVVDRSGAQLWLTSPRLPSFDQGIDIPARARLVLQARAEVAGTEEVEMVNADVRTPHGAKIAATVIGYDLRPGAFVMPQAFWPKLADVLRMPGGIVVDEADAPKLGAAVGTVLEINGHRAPVVGLTRHFRGVGGVYIFTSLASARYFGSEGIKVPAMTTFIAARLTDPSLAAKVRDEIQPQTASRSFDAWTSEGLSRHSQLYWLLETGMGVGMLFSVLIGIVVGVVITSQTLRAVILNSLKEFATLRALGVPVAALRGIVLELAGWIGVLGLVGTGVAGFVLAVVADKTNVSLHFPWWTIVATIVFTFAVAFVSGFVALHALYATEPAELLR
jgi:putative ABC transport system permease protein